MLTLLPGMCSEEEVGFQVVVGIGCGLGRLGLHTEDKANQDWELPAPLYFLAEVP